MALHQLLLSDTMAMADRLASDPSVPAGNRIEALEELADHVEQLLTRVEDGWATEEDGE